MKDFKYLESQDLLLMLFEYDEDEPVRLYDLSNLLDTSTYYVYIKNKKNKKSLLFYFFFLRMLMKHMFYIMPQEIFKKYMLIKIMFISQHLKYEKYIILIL